MVAGTTRRRVYRAGLIGCGRIGADVSTRGSSRIKCHAAAYRGCPRVRLVAASDVNETSLRQAGARWGIARLYTDYQEMLQREPLDVISICTPTSTHAKVLNDVLTEGRVAGVLVEKPIALTIEEAVALAERASAAHVTVSVNYIRRFCPVYRQVRQEVQAGQWGKPQYIHAMYTKGVIHNGTHLLDLVSWFLGPPSAVMAMERRGGADDPTVSLRLVWPGEATAWLQGADSEAFNIFDVDLLCTEGRLRFVDQGHRLERYGLEEVSARRGFRQLAATPIVQSTRLDQAIRYAVEDLIDSLEQGRNPACTLDDAARALVLAVGALNQSAVEISL